MRGALTLERLGELVCYCKSRLEPRAWGNSIGKHHTLTACNIDNIATCPNLHCPQHGSLRDPDRNEVLPAVRRCAYPGCNFQSVRLDRRTASLFCSTHKCRKTDCLSLRKGYEDSSDGLGSPALYCEGHACAVPACPNERLNGERKCKPHLEEGRYECDRRAEPQPFLPEWPRF